MTDKRREVEELRQEIGKVDAQLLACARAPREALEEGRRGAQVARVADLAARARADRGASCRARSAGDLPPEALREIFREIVADVLLARAARSWSRTAASTAPSLMPRRGAASASRPSTSPCDIVACDARRGHAPARELRGRSVRDAHRRPHAGRRLPRSRRATCKIVACFETRREPPAREQGRFACRDREGLRDRRRTARIASASSRPSCPARR